MGIRKENMLRHSRLTNISRARKLFIYWGIRDLGLSGKEVAGYLGITKGAVSRSISRGEKLSWGYKLK